MDLKTTGILLAGIICAGLVFGLASFRDIPSPNANENYLGSIVISSSNGSDCRRFKFDNSTGNIKAMAAGDCKPQAVGPADRLSAISKAFKGGN